MLESLAGQRVVVVGLGKSGVGAVRLLRQLGARVTLEESKHAEELGKLDPVLLSPEVTLELGRPLEAARLADARLVVVSPGVPLSLPALQAARERGQEVIGEVELAWRHLPHDVPWIGITGTNGKSTTTALTGALFTAAGKHPFVGGNLGTPLSSAGTLEPRPGAYVVEYSSFQLEGIEDTALDAAAILNLTPDHLDRYPSVAAYGDAKLRIFARASANRVAVLNLDDPFCAQAARSLPGRVHGFTLAAEATPASLGVDMLARGKAGGGGFELLGASGEAHSFALANPALRGPHNVQNAMAACLLASACGVPAGAIQQGLSAFPGLPHRLELVRTLDGVEWVNDSKATNVDSSVIALNAFSQRRIWLIAGGKGKGATYAPLAAAGRQKVAGVLTVGQDAHNIEREFGDAYVIHPCHTLEKAVQRARELSRSGDVVLLSPACASYDQFKNFEDRGDTFKRLVMSL